MPKDPPRLDKRLFTVNERILLHLKESGSTGHSLDLPAPMTQDGIAAALGIRVNHVSRAVKALQKRGCLREATSRVKGEVRRRKIYLITEEGMAVANKVIGEITATAVSVRDSRQRLRDMPTAEARQLLLPPRTYTSMLAQLDERGVLDIFKAKAKEKKEAEVSRFLGAPAVAPFYGRVEEMRRLRAWLQAKKPPVMVVKGEQGIGKTVLALNAAKSIEGKRPIFWFSFPPEGGRDAFIPALSEFLQEVGKTDLAAWVGQESIDGGELRRRAEASLMDLGAVLIIDNIPSSHGGQGALIQVVTEAAALTGNQVLLTIREMPDWGRDLSERRLLEHLTLHGLDPDSCRKLAPDMHEKEFLKAFKLARGNPLEIKLLAEQVEEHAGHEELTPEERALLHYLRMIHERRVR